MRWPWSKARQGVVMTEPEPASPAAPEPEIAAEVAEEIAPGGPIGDYLRALLHLLRAIKGGAVATYIPELARADPALCAIVIATVDGQIYTAGDCDHAFTIQSVSKPFLYGLMLGERGRESMLAHVGVEPSGGAFNEMAFDTANNRPINPMVNAGAIAVAALVKGDSVAARLDYVRAHFSTLAGRQLSIDDAVMRSEQETGDRNRAIAAAMHEVGMIKGDPSEILDVYFGQCSVLVTARDLATMGATLANEGINPITGSRALAADSVADVLTVMNTCGMYNYAGEWSYEIGMPAKSGVSGSVLAVIPGQAGIAIFSPPIDERGNSLRAIAACKEIARDFGLHLFHTNPNPRTVVRRVLYGDVIRSKRARTQAERAVLEREGRRICIVEAQDALFFGSAERVVRAISETEADYVVLDVRRVSSADRAARMLLLRLAPRLKAAGRRLLFAHLDARGPLAGLREDVDAALGADALFEHRDHALEWCENRLIAELAAARNDTSYSLAGLDMFKGLEPAALKALGTAAKPLMFEPGQVIVREGDRAHLFYAVTQGTVSVRLKLETESGVRSVRVASFGPGMSFGEMALLDGGVRSADVVADEKVVCYGFSVEELRELGQAHPSILIVMFANMARDLSERLRRASNEIRALEQ